MASVIVYDKDKIDELLDGTFVAAQINGEGELVFTKGDGSFVNLGAVLEADHGNLSGLGDDDHTQYALADGSRGDFASETQGTKADNARPNVGATVSIQAGETDGDGYLEKVTITNDGSDSGDWINRVEFNYNDGVQATRLVHFINEYGEWRGAPARHNTVGFRMFVKENPSRPTESRSTTVPVMELMDDRTNRNSLWGVMGDGQQTRNGIRMADVLYLSGGASVPAGTPAGTVIVRTD